MLFFHNFLGIKSDMDSWKKWTEWSIRYSNSDSFIWQNSFYTIHLQVPKTPGLDNWVDLEDNYLFNNHPWLKMNG